MIFVLIGIFIVSFFVLQAVLLKMLRADNTGPAFFIAAGITLIAWAIMAGKV